MTQETEADALFSLVQEYINKHPEYAERLQLPKPPRKYNKPREIKNTRCEVCHKLILRTESIMIRVRVGTVGYGQWIVECRQCYARYPTLRIELFNKYNRKEKNDATIE